MCFDLGSKYLARITLSMIEPIVLIPQVLSLQLVYNSGAAYGILQGQTTFLLVVTAIIIVCAFWFQKYFDTSVWSRLGLTMVISGAFGNGLDRLVYGQVTDMFNIHIIPVFNVADICINIGMVCFIIDFILTYRNDAQH